MPDYTKTYSTLVVQPVDLVNAFKLDFCFASVIKWFTKWHMDGKMENIIKVKYYTSLCRNTPNPLGLVFSLRMYCIANGFMDAKSTSCPLLVTCNLILANDIDKALKYLNGID